jgi:hypothetical protein
MRKRIAGLVGVCASVAMISFCGDKGNNPPVEPATTVPISSLRLDSTAFPGWTDSSYMTGDTNDVTTAVDGGAIQLIKHGMRYFSEQLMDNGLHSAKLDVFDFVTVQAAKNMFAYTFQNTGGFAWGTYDPAKVVITNTPYYATVTAQVNKYYFELSFSVVNDDTLFVDSCANLFYSKYVSILK